MSDDPNGGLFEGIDRRGYLRGLAAAGGAATLGLQGASGTAAAVDISDRRNDAYDKRVQAAQDLIQNLTEYPNKDQPTAARYVNGDPTNRVYNKYRKALDNSLAHGADPSSYDALVSAVESADGDYESIPIGGDRRLICPRAGRRYTADGMDSWLATIPQPPAFDSDRMAAEMNDVYWMSTLRDVPLEELDDFNFTGSSDYQTDLSYIDSNLGSYPWADTDEPFRGAGHGTDNGPYLSQFLLHPAQMGSMPSQPLVQTLPLPQDGHGLTNVDSLADGTAGGSAEPFGTDISGHAGDPTENITNGRHLASLVRDEPSYLHYFRAALQMIGWGVTTTNGMPFIDEYDDTERSLAYVNFGGAGVLDLLARAAKNALNAAWYQKWVVHRRQRPESYAANVDRSVGPVPSELDPSSGALNGSSRAQTYNDTQFGVDQALLAQAYSEGSPAHPAYPSGHSAIAGACGTVLKLFFQNDYLDAEIEQAGDTVRQSTSDGDAPEPASGDNDTSLPVHYEINKLIDNVGVARIWAGVHYWSDHTYGVKLGEQVGLATVMHHLYDEYGLEDEYSGDETLVKSHMSYTDYEGTFRRLTVDHLEQLRDANRTL